MNIMKRDLLVLSLGFGSMAWALVANY